MLKLAPIQPIGHEPDGPSAPAPAQTPPRGARPALRLVPPLPDTPPVACVPDAYLPGRSLAHMPLADLACPTCGSMAPDGDLGWELEEILNDLSGFAALAAALRWLPELTLVGTPA